MTDVNIMIIIAHVMMSGTACKFYFVILFISWVIFY